MEIGSIGTALAVASLGDVRRASETAASRPEVPAPRDPGDAGPKRSEAAPAPVAEPVSVEENAGLRHQITLDQATHKIVYEALDTLTGEVVYQLPDPRYLKAYAEQMKAAEEEAASAHVQRLA